MGIPKLNSTTLYLTAAPLLTAVFLLSFYALGGFYPFGSGSISWCDMDQQVIPLLLNFKDILTGHGSVLYSLQNAGGMNFLGVFFFFLASPFSLLTLFVDKSDLLLFMNILVLLKLCTCAFTATLYFIRTKRSLKPELAALFGLFYALSGYGLMFYQNIIWLDMMYLFPLLLLAFEHLIHRKKATPYVIALSAMMVVNYYIGYMVVLFTLLYFGLVTLSLSGPSRKQVAIRFLTASFIAALLTAVVWLPSFLQYLSSGRDISIFESLMESNLYTHFETTLAILFPSIGVIVFCLYGLVHQPLRNGQLRDYVLLSLLLLIPIFIEPINKLWHTGNYQAFPVRYGFMTIFMLLTVAGQLTDRSLCCPLADDQRRPASTFGRMIRAVLILIGIVAFGVFSHYYTTANIETLSAYSRSLWGNLDSLQGLFLLSVLAAVLYLFLFRGLCKRIYTTRFFAAACALLFLFESYANTQVYMFSADYDWHLERYENALALSGYTPPEEDNNEFYRVKLREKYFDVNLVGGLGYPSLSHYTSLTSQDYMFAMKKLGYSSYWMEVGGYGGSLLADAALSVAYDIHWFTDEPAVYQTQQFSISQTPFTLPLGIVTTESLADTNQLEELSRLDVQKLLYQKLLPNLSSPFVEYSPTHYQNSRYYLDDWNQYQIELEDSSQTGHFRYLIEIDGRQTLYFDCFDRLSNDLAEHINGSFQIVVNDIILEDQYPSQLNNGLVNLGTFEDQIVLIDIQVLQSVTCGSFGVFGIDHDLLATSLNEANTLNLKAEDRSISGTVHSAEASTVFLSIPYDAGWHLQIDGETTELTQAFLGFTAFSLPAGTHNIQLTYLPPGFILGLCLTLFALVLCLTVKILQKKRPASIASLMEHAGLQTFSCIMTYVLFAIVIAVVYILPLCLALYTRLYL